MARLINPTTKTNLCMMQDLSHLYTIDLFIIDMAKFLSWTWIIKSKKSFSLGQNLEFFCSIRLENMDMIGLFLVPSG
jgi:hypothetical protein